LSKDLESCGYLERCSGGRSSHRKCPEVGLELGQSDRGGRTRGVILGQMLEGFVGNVRTLLFL